MVRSRRSKGIEFPGKGGEVNFWEPGARSRFQALIELGAPGSKERCILESTSKHLKGRGGKCRRKTGAILQIWCLDMIGLAISKNEWKYHAIAWYNHAI